VESGRPTLLRVERLRTEFSTPHGVVRAVDGVSFEVGRGETLGLVGESGSGKSVTCLSLLRLVPSPGRIEGGRVLLEGEDLLTRSDAEMRTIRGRKISMILQDPLTSLNPVLTVGSQVAETLAVHQRLRGRALRERVVEMLQRVGIADAAQRTHDYPHQFSGGMRQRIAGAIALACRPAVLIADEPTTSLDATVQAQYLRLLRRLQREGDFGMLFVSHDLGTVARVCDRVAVMYAGRIVETAPTAELFARPVHPYTIGLLRAIPRWDDAEGPLVPLDGQPPILHALPAGCHFTPRCRHAMDVCRDRYPDETAVGAEHQVRCWRSTEPTPRG
jgi:oligopeptide/dipeptide ABC transporter ATP-binding protein